MSLIPAIFVLFAFLTNVPASVSCEHQPWLRLDLRQLRGALLPAWSDAAGPAAKGQAE